jgi:cytochrome c oxidase subunit 3
MTSASEPLATLPVPHTGIGPLETNRGVYAVATLIITEAALFVCLFASYYFLANNKDRWSIDIPPKLTLALLMLGILIASSLVMMWGERMVKLGRYSVARFAVILTVVMGLVFLAVQTAEYRDHWKTLTPLTDPYGSIFLHHHHVPCRARGDGHSDALLSGDFAQLWATRATNQNPPL